MHNVAIYNREGEIFHHQPIIAFVSFYHATAKAVDIEMKGAVGQKESSLFLFLVDTMHPRPAVNAGRKANQSDLESNELEC